MLFLQDRTGGHNDGYSIGWDCTEMTLKVTYIAAFCAAGYCFYL